uniref:OCIA domain-containing protein n=1 Tax=Anopheles culicifacies TaxID=139723 RepID=A0A182MBZ1_9DIPT
MGFGAWYAVHNKFLKPSVRFGPAPKILVGVTLGYFIGKISYQSKCAEKIMQLPNSRLADLMRQRRQGTTGMADKLYDFYQESHEDILIMSALTSTSSLPDQGFGASSMLTPFETTPARERQADESFLSNGSLNLYYDGPQYSGLDDSGRPTVDSTTNFEEDLQLPLAPKASKSYEELRRQNREEYLKRQQQPYRPATILEDSPPIRRETTERRGSNASDEASLPPGPPSVKNKYGDAWSQ